MKPLALPFFVLFVAKFGVCTQITNPFDTFYRGEPSPIGYGDLYKTRKFQMAQLAETNLFTKEEDQCLQRSLCALGSVSDSVTWPRHSLGQGLEQFHKTLEKVSMDITNFTNFKDHFPKIDQALGQYVFFFILL